jgi:hypothetical protein
MKIYTDKQLDVIYGELLELEKLVSRNSYVVSAGVRTESIHRLKRIREVLLEGEVVNIQVQTE